MIKDCKTRITEMTIVPCGSCGGSHTVNGELIMRTTYICFSCSDYFIRENEQPSINMKHGCGRVAKINNFETNVVHN